MLGLVDMISLEPKWSDKRQKKNSFHRRLPYASLRKTRAKKKPYETLYSS